MKRRQSGSLFARIMSPRAKQLSRRVRELKFGLAHGRVSSPRARNRRPSASERRAGGARGGAGRSIDPRAGSSARGWGNATRPSSVHTEAITSFARIAWEAPAAGVLTPSSSARTPLLLYVPGSHVVFYAYPWIVPDLSNHQLTEQPTTTFRIYEDLRIEIEYRRHYGDVTKSIEMSCSGCSHIKIVTTKALRNAVGARTPTRSG
ncbi:hypothetical protein EVAR_43811_1 [Eumeta japonica]|uniref:Uncharacterized protein n=1 Tax=Eumeta variegata TaxID=151549 RepID=A0A4C1X109_EUMVA|nr:hypothetical protein EVAR_43811_1 [Eumeta japonica]